MGLLFWVDAVKDFTMLLLLPVTVYLLWRIAVAFIRIEEYLVHEPQQEKWLRRRF